MIFTEPRENPRFRRRRLMVKEKNSGSFFCWEAVEFWGRVAFLGKHFGEVVFF